MMNNILYNYIPEKGIHKIILNYKNIFEDFEEQQEWDKFIKKYNNDWYHISKSGKLTEKFIRKYNKKLDINMILYYQRLPENFIREFLDRMCWRTIVGTCILSEEFLIEFENKIDWKYISYAREFSENFLERYKNFLDWNYIIMQQKISEKFIRNNFNIFKYKIYMLIKYQVLSPEFYIDFNKEIQEIQEIQDCELVCKKKHIKKCKIICICDYNRRYVKNILSPNHKLLSTYKKITNLDYDIKLQTLKNERENINITFIDTFDEKNKKILSDDFDMKLEEEKKYTENKIKEKRLKEEIEINKKAGKNQNFYNCPPVPSFFKVDQTLILGSLKNIFPSEKHIYYL